MTEPDETPLTGAERAVQRLLASARHTDPVPPEVAARLDGVLAGLAAGDLPTHDPGAAPVTDLDVHRRRRRVTSLLVAAAAVVVVGVGLNQVIDRAGDSATSDESSAADAPAASQEDAGSAGSGAQPARPEKDGTFRARKQVAEVRPESFDSDVLRLQRLVAPYNGGDALTADGVQPGDLAAGAACRSSTWGSGTFVPVSYGGSPAVLVLRRPQGDTQVADLYLCGATTPVRSVTLPAP
ncbi:hypothetical protein [Nocardioides taihuensis]|uniref:Uncharacterized protein n=1 Tax=Nocardioides taihuensis TaxID=1835606 RepID=A0ABW0BGZ2_9ACTN